MSEPALDTSPTESLDVAVTPPGHIRSDAGSTGSFLLFLVAGPGSFLLAFALAGLLMSAAIGGSAAEGWVAVTLVLLYGVSLVVALVLDAAWQGRSAPPASGV